MIKKISRYLSAKVFIINTAIMALACGIIYLCVVFLMPLSYQLTLGNQFMNNFRELIPEIENLPFEEAKRKMNDFALANKAMFTLMNSSGDVIATFPENITVGYENEELEVSNEQLYISVMFENNGTLYTLDANSSLSGVNEVRDVLIGLLPFVAIIILLISTLASFFFSRYLTRPIVDISKASQKMAALDFTWKCNQTRQDEIGILAKNLNSMSENLNKAFSELETANRNLQMEMEKERLLEKQRQDFFAAVSHELKTPLTVLKGELEGMLAGVGDFTDRDKYLKHSLGTVLSIEELVKEILTITKLSAGDIRATFARCDLSELVLDCCEQYEILAVEKDIRFQMDVSKARYAYINEALITKAISNIVSNAIRHSSNGAEVYILLECEKNRPCLTVSNSSAYIEPSQLQSIFEPFYRVDKSRNRFTGGSGLGLYITKNILDIHGAECKIYNANNGVSVKVFFDNGNDT